MLISVREFDEDPAPYGVSTVPSMILYSDGRLISWKDGELMEGHLAHQEMCALANTIEGLGFFDFSRKDYDDALDRLVQAHKLSYGVWSGAEIEVNVWRQRKEDLSLLDDPSVPAPANLRALYRLLTTYQPADLVPYPYDLVVMALYQYPRNYFTTASQAWPVVGISLAETWDRATQQNREQGKAVLVAGQTAHDVYEATRTSRDGQFSENGIFYFVSARPLYPYENLASRPRPVCQCFHRPEWSLPRSRSPATPQMERSPCHDSLQLERDAGNCRVGRHCPISGAAIYAACRPGRLLGGTVIGISAALMTVQAHASNPVLRPYFWPTAVIPALTVCREA